METLPTAPPAPRDTPSAFLRRNLRLIAVVLFLVVLGAAFEFSGLAEHFDLAFMRQTILRHEVGGLVLFVLLFALGNLVQIPGLLFLVAAVLTLGKVSGASVTYVAAVISCMFTFVVVRFLGGDALRQVRNRVARRILAELDRYPIASVVLLRVLFQTAPAVNYALALSGIKLRNYVIGTLVGLPLPIVLYCLFFDALVARLHIG